MLGFICFYIWFLLQLGFQGQRQDMEGWKGEWDLGLNVQLKRIKTKFKNTMEIILINICINKNMHILHFLSYLSPTTIIFIFFMGLFNTSLCSAL